MWPFSKKAREASPALTVDGISLAEFVTQLLPDLRRWLFKYSGPGAELDDLVQEALIEIIRAMPSFRGESSPRTFAHRIAIRCAYHQLKRARSHRGTVYDEHQVASGVSPEADALTREAVRALYSALDQLTEKRRNAFVLCAIEKLSHEEAAEIEEVDLETLRARLKHARKDLTELIRTTPSFSVLSSWMDERESAPHARTVSSIENRDRIDRTGPPPIPRTGPPPVPASLKPARSHLRRVQ